MISIVVHQQAQFEAAAKDGKQSPDLIFTNSQGGLIGPDNLTKRFITACNRAGIEPHEGGRPWSVHELRHTAASQLLNDRVPMQIVSRTLGHSSIAVTLDVYSHLTDQDSELVADSMNDQYGQKRGRIRMKISATVQQLFTKRNLRNYQKLRI